MKQFSIDTQEPVTIDEIIEGNEDLSREDIRQIDNLQVGESCFIGVTEVKRVE
jgi:hypothetical protein